MSFCRKCTKLPHKKSFHSPQSVFLCWLYTYGGASNQWCANPWKRRLPKFNGVSMTVQVVKKRRGRSAVWCVGRFASEKKRHRRRVIDVVYEADASNSIEGADKLNREIYGTLRRRIVRAALVHSLVYRSLSSICYYLLDVVIESASSSYISAG